MVPHSGFYLHFSDNELSYSTLQDLYVPGPCNKAVQQRLGLGALEEQDEKSTVWTTQDTHRSWGGWGLLPSEVETGGGQLTVEKGLWGVVSEHRNKSRDVSQLGPMSLLHRSRKSPMKNETSCNFTESLPIFTQSFHFDFEIIL